MDQAFVARMNEAFEEIRRRHRLGREATQAAVARLLHDVEGVDVGGPAISKWLSGATAPTLKNLFHFARLAGLNPGYVAWGHEGTEGEIPEKRERVDDLYRRQPKPE